MLIELRTKSQITIPKDIVSSLDLSVGDKFEISEKDGIIYLVPVIIYPKKYLNELQNEIKQLKDNIHNGNQLYFDNVDSLIKNLEEE